jgi:hypothetical protein
MVTKVLMFEGGECLAVVKQSVFCSFADMIQWPLLVLLGVVFIPIHAFRLNLSVNPVSGADLFIVTQVGQQIQLLIPDTAYGDNVLFRWNTHCKNTPYPCYNASHHLNANFTLSNIIPKLQMSSLTHFEIFRTGHISHIRILP